MNQMIQTENMICITGVDPNGTPTRAVCTACGHDPHNPHAVWRRPDDDPDGHTLADWLRVHYRNRKTRQ